MGVYAQLDKYFDDVLREEEKARLKRNQELLDLETNRDENHLTPEEMVKKRGWIEREYELKLSPEQWAVFHLLQGDKTAKVHVHKEDDVLF